MSQVQFAFDGISLITPEMISAETLSLDTGPDAAVAKNARVQLALLLNICKRRFESDEPAARVLHYVFRELHEMRRQLPAEVWQGLVPIVQDHPISQLIHQDPFTRRSFEKPRGYSGDAGLLDFIYGHPSIDDALAAASPFGKALYAYTTSAPAASAVRERRDLLARHVDAVASARGAETEILTIAAGHLREADLSEAFREKRIKRWVALDQDTLSVDAMSRDLAGTCVEPMAGSVRGLLDDSYDLGRFDFIYAAGLYDYLPRSVAVKLTRKCLQALKPNGVFLFANFHETIDDDAFMETFMNWSLILRSEQDVWDIINACVDRNTVETNVEFGANRNILYGTIGKL